MRESKIWECCGNKKTMVERAEDVLKWFGHMKMSEKRLRGSTCQKWKDQEEAETQLEMEEWSKRCSGLSWPEQAEGYEAYLR